MTQEPIIKTPIPAKNNKGTMLVLSLLFDFIGMVSYFVPVFAEVTDLFWAPNYCKDPLQSPVFSNGDLRSRWMVDPTVKLCNQEAGKLMRKQ